MATKPDVMEVALDELDVSIDSMELVIRELSKVKPSKRFVLEEIFAHSSIDKITDALKKANQARDILIEWLERGYMYGKPG